MDETAGGEVFPEVTIKRIEEVVVIPESRNQVITKREQIPQLVEQPLVSACENLYDKNIRTLSSSANSQDLLTKNTPECFANIVVDFDTLSEENKKIIAQLTEEGKATALEDYDERVCYQLKFPISKATTIEELTFASTQSADKFQKQPMTWAPTYSLLEIAEIYQNSELLSMAPQDIANETGYFYDSESKLFYESEEHFAKAKDLSSPQE